ncbi:acyltransferase family protein [Methylobacterium sp. WSM2598]|uniref:acyltransferase family protein n=1 Tax=Methylobacterium sp. WSM2598 TaxID=398261 RepID=UPI000362FCC1|nr:acyltransferase [Methylobacterium sp. WSM2598]
MTDGRRANNLGLLRLLLAGLVVVSHSPELIDGDRSREILTRLTGTLSFGEVAVDGFFVLSGYLITRSWLTSASGASYLAKRVLRIYPGYLVASLACIGIVAPLAGGDLAALRIPDALGRLLLLGTPAVPRAFEGLPYPYLNGAAWTIVYEFACYLLVAGLGCCGLLRPDRRFLAGMALLAGLCLLVWHPALASGSPLLFKLKHGLRFALIFACGSAFFLLGERIRFSAGRAALAALLLAGLLGRPGLAEPAFVVLGGFLLLWFAFAVPPLRIGRFTQRTDLSYGVYLYAWPLQNLIVAQDRGVAPWLVTVAALTGAGLLAWLSWHLVERPALARRDVLARLFARIAASAGRLAGAGRGAGAGDSLPPR